MALVRDCSNLAVVLTVVVDLLLIDVCCYSVPIVCGFFMVGPHYDMQYLVSFLVLQSSC